MKQACAIDERGLFASSQAAKLTESSRVLEEEEAARLATSALCKRDLVLNLRKVQLPCSCCC